MHPSTNRPVFLTFLLYCFISTLSAGIAFPVFSFIIWDPSSLVGLTHSSQVEKGFSLGFLLALGPIATFFAAPTLGYFSDHKGKKRILIGVIFLLAIGQFLSAIGIMAKSLWVLFLSRVIVGIGAGGGSIISSIIANSSAPEGKAKNFALLSSCSTLGIIIGPFLGGKLAEDGLFYRPFFVAACMTVLNLILILICYKDHGAGIDSNQRKRKSMLAEMSSLLAYKNIRAVIIVIPLFSIGWALYWLFVSVSWIQQYGFSEKQVGYFYSYGAVWFVLCAAVFIRPILSWVRNVTIIFVACFMLGIVVLATLYQPAISFWILIPIQEFFMALLAPAGSAFVSNLVKKEEQGILMGVLQSIQSLTSALVPLLGGALLAINYHAPTLVGGLLVILSSVVMLFGYRKLIFKEGHGS